MHIAVIEEERPIQELVRCALELGEHTVDTYYETPETLSSYDLVIIEPGEYGQGLPAILRLTNHHNLPVLILTFHEWNIDKAQKLHIPILRKMPFRLNPLLEMVDQLYGSRQEEVPEACDGIPTLLCLADPLTSGHISHWEAMGMELAEGIQFRPSSI